MSDLYSALKALEGWIPGDNAGEMKTGPTTEKRWIKRDEILAILARFTRVEEPGLLLAAQSVVDGWDAGDDMPEYIEELRKELAPKTDVLREAWAHLASFAKHASDCAALDGDDCTCGLTDAKHAALGGREMESK